MEEIKVQTQTHLQGFINFIREQGVVGLAVGFVIGGAVSQTVSSFVEHVINPLVGFLLGRASLTERVLVLGDVSLAWGAFISSLIDFIIIAAVVYFGIKWIGLEKLDKKK